MRLRFSAVSTAAVVAAVLLLYSGVHAVPTALPNAAPAEHGATTQQIPKEMEMSQPPPASSSSPPLPPSAEGSKEGGAQKPSFAIDTATSPKKAPEEGAVRMMKDKPLLLAPLLLMKLMMKAITPVLLAVVGLKASKALLLSKLSFLLVAGFLLVQLCQKLGMGMNGMGMGMSMGNGMSMPQPAPISDSYGPPSGWDSDNNAAPGPYSRIATVADPHRLAYSHHAQS